MKKDKKKKEVEPTKPAFDWESCEYICRSTHGKTQKKTIYHPCDHECLSDLTEYVVWDELTGMPALDMHDHSFKFKQHGIESGYSTRLLIEGSIDFMCGCGGLRLRIEIDQAGDEKEYLEELLRELEQAKILMEDRLDYLKTKKGTHGDA